MKIKCLDERCRPEQHGDWVDLKVCAFDSAVDKPGYNWFIHDRDSMFAQEAAKGCRRFAYPKGAIFKVSLGVAMEIPKGYHAQVVARSSTRKHYGVMLTNAIGIIDEAYNGDNDIWFAEFVALQDGEMQVGDRILQFRLVKNGYPIELEYVEHLGNADRGGHGSTGR